MATTKAFELAQLSALTNVDTSGNVTTNTSQIANASGHLTVDSVGDLHLDVGGQIKLDKNGVLYGNLFNSSNDLGIHVAQTDQRLVVSGSDGGTPVNAFILDMANGGRATFSENVVVSGNLNSSGDIGVGGDLTVTGDLTVEGATVSLNTTDLNVEDKNIILNYHASNDTSATADQAGITIQDAVISGTDASILWNATDDKFIISHKMDVTGSISVASTNPVLTLQDTDATTTYNRTEFQNSGGGLNLNTRHSNGTFVSTDYQIGKNASGAVEHKWFIAGTARHRITSAGDAEWYENNDGTQQVGMHWDYADGYLGIGETDPTTLLHIKGDSAYASGATDLADATTKAVVRIRGSNDSSTSIWMGGLANSMPYLQVANYNGSANDNLIFNPYGGNVGIRTETPSETLELTRLGKIGFGMNGNYGARIGYFDDGSGTHGFHVDTKHIGTTTSETRFVVRADSGNVGIGTKTPQDELVVHSDSNPTISIIGASYNDEIGIKFGGGDLANALSDGNCGAQILSQQAVLSGQAKGDLQFKVNTGDSIQTAMFIGNDANVGVNTSQPFAKSHIKDTGWSTGAPYGTVQLIEGRATNDHNWSQLVVTDTDDTNGNGGAISFATGVSTALNPFASIKGYREGANHGALDLYTRPNGGTSTRRMRIDSNGNVGIGTDSLTAKLNVHDDTTTTDSATLVNRTSTAFGWEEEYWFNARVTASTAGTAYVTFQFSNASTTNLHNMHIDYTFGLYREHPTLGSTEGDTVKGTGSYHNTGGGGDTARSGEAEVIGVGIVDDVYIETTGTYAFRLAIAYVSNGAVKNISGKIKLLNNPATGTSPAVTVTV